MSEKDRSENDELTPRQRAALEALLTAPTMQSAADAAKIGTRQLRRYLALPTFRKELAQRQGEALALAAYRLSGQLDAALDVIGKALAGDYQEPQQVQAARVVLGHVAELVEFASLEARITALERLVNEGGNKNQET